MHIWLGMLNKQAYLMQVKKKTEVFISYFCGDEARKWNNNQEDELFFFFQISFPEARSFPTTYTLISSIMTVRAQNTDLLTAQQ